MVGKLYINGIDAYTAWGVTLGATGLSKLMTPAGNKEYIKNASRLEHGSRLIANNPKMDEREVQLDINLCADTEAEFFAKYAAFCEVLAHGKITINTCYQPNVHYKMYYINCTQFAQYHRGIAKFTLKLVEPNPNNREE